MRGRFGNTFFTANEFGVLDGGQGISTEDHADGKAYTEIEAVWYATLSNWDQLSNASKVERQVQNDVPVREEKRKGLIRVRRTHDCGQKHDRNTPSNESDYAYSQIVKAKQNQTQEANNKEVALEVTKDFFDIFSMIAISGMVKDRYSFPVENSDLVFEVDCFLTPDAIQARESGLHCEGDFYHPWVKIDLEHKEGDTIPDLPIQFDEVIQQGAESNPRITELYDKYFIIDHLK